MLPAPIWPKLRGWLTRRPANATSLPSSSHPTQGVILVGAFYRPVPNIRLLAEDIESRVVRLMVNVRLRVSEGWSDARSALVDPGSPYCLFPHSAWAASEHRIFTQRHLRLVGIGSGVAMARFGEVTLVVEDGLATSPPLRVKALLLQDDSEPLLLGFEDFLTCAVLHSDYARATAWLEFAETG